MAFLQTNRTRKTGRGQGPAPTKESCMPYDPNVRHRRSIREVQPRVQLSGWIRRGDGAARDDTGTAAVCFMVCAFPDLRGLSGIAFVESESVRSGEVIADSIADFRLRIADLSSFRDVW